MSPSIPGPNDYLIEWRTVIGYGSAPVWTISRNGDILHVFPGEPLALRAVRELARLEHCHAWLISEGADPVLLPSSASA